MDDREYYNAQCLLDVFAKSFPQQLYKSAYSAALKWTQKSMKLV